MRILKFGGSSVADPGQIKNVISIVKQYDSAHPDLCIVVSAQSGVTDQLVKICELISTQRESCEAIIQEVEQRHLATLKALLPVAQQPAAMAEVMAMCNELSDITKGASLVGEVTPRTHDLILSFGERLSAFVISQALKSEIGHAQFVDARQLIRTDGAFGRAKVNFEVSNKLIQEYFEANKGLNVVTGFIASSLQGKTTTLGRSGSDYTAAILGAALQADAIEIWTDVDGVMTADPRYVKEAQSIEQLSYNEAMELSHFGAKVIFPSTMQPAMAAQIPILVKNAFNPAHKGTLICKESGKDSSFIKGVASLINICLINVEGSGMVGVAGVSARMFSTLSQQQISVILISQASSEHSICIGLIQEDAEKACQLLRQTFADELLAGLISSIFYEGGLAIVAVVGENMRQTPGVSARVFGPLGRNGINVKAISQGSSELNISIVIKQDDLKKALRILHQSLFSYDLLQLHLYVAGTGAIGGKLLEMIESQHEYLASQKISLKICGLINSRKMIISENDININNWKASMENDAEKAHLQHFVDKSLQQNMENSVFIDVTASGEPVRYYNNLLSNNIAIVAANKRANTQSMEQYNLLQTSARKRNTPFLYETNVGAGLPVINVLRSLMASGDKVMKIEAVLSGTMNYLLSEYNGDQSFSELVQFAKDKNYAEPDPRDDLSGMDVARKCLILARECGWGIELDEIEVETLMSLEAASAKDIPAFFEELKNYDKIFQKHFEEAKGKGKRIRYVADIENGKAKVSVIEVDETHPFYSLKGTENCICLTTKYYQQYPMVIKGPGAGVNVTSAGVLADIVRIAEGLKR
ncbi:MAG: bifunctional aspartate kinase/homoserine dehydrogenase I [Porphyromonadaceae bacterium]|nr:MAG: bifunctional aspartate kinase/homoserine dehydrogenase I [Porphyromonadaceae bacterium]